MEKFDIKKAVFETSFGLGGKFIQDGPQIAMVGRSNVGKSSLINSLCRNSKLARISASPGKTRLINYFRINDSFYLVDLPGYGYAKVSKAEQESWGKLMESYLSGGSVSHIFMLIDIRHEPTAADKQMLEWIIYYGIPYTLIATKADKIKRSQLQKQLKVIRLGLNTEKGAILIPFSAETKQGREEIWDLVDQILASSGETNEE